MYYIIIFRIITMTVSTSSGRGPEGIHFILSQKVEFGLQKKVQELIMSLLSEFSKKGIILVKKH